MSIHCTHITCHELSKVESLPLQQDGALGPSHLTLIPSIDQEALIKVCEHDQPIALTTIIRYNPNISRIGPLYPLSPLSDDTYHEIHLALANSVSTPTACIDVAPEHIDIWKKQGYQASFEIDRIALKRQSKWQYPLSRKLFDLRSRPIEAISAYEASYCLGERSWFLSQWLEQPSTLGLGYVEQNTLKGIGILSASANGLIIGPLYADSSEIATVILDGLMANSRDHTLYMDVPKSNPHALDWIKPYRSEKISTHMRMYQGDLPTIAWPGVFATSGQLLG